MQSSYMKKTNTEVFYYAFGCKITINKNIRIRPYESTYLITNTKTTKPTTEVMAWSCICKLYNKMVRYLCFYHFRENINTHCQLNITETNLY